MNLKTALDFARAYRQQNQAADALRVLADTVLELRGENRVLRELVNETKPSEAR